MMAYKVLRQSLWRKFGRLKLWHVRNKDNILKVKKDEENARKEEEEKQRKVALAESEARTELLRKQASSKKEIVENDDLVEEDQVTLPSTSSTSGHINFFSDLEEGKKTAKGNEEYEKEKRQEKEKQEKAIGLLTYLGQSAIEAQEEKPWYLKQFGDKRKREVEEEPERQPSKQSEELHQKFKRSLDPLHMMNKYLTTKRKVEDPSYKATNKPMYKQFVKKELKTEPIPLTATLKEEDKSVNAHVKKEHKHEKKESSHKKHKKEKKNKSKKKRHKKKHQHKKHNKHSNSSSDTSDEASTSYNSSNNSIEKRKKNSKKRKRSRKETSSSRSSDSDISDSVKESASKCSSGSSEKTVQQLRAERLRRETAERQKTKQLLDKMSGKVEEKREVVEDDRSRGYNSLFNPEFVRKPKRRRTDYSNF